MVLLYPCRQTQNPCLCGLDLPTIGVQCEGLPRATLANLDNFTAEETDAMKHDNLTDAAPSAEFVEAISRFFDTDPSDLLLELGYYTRTEENCPAEMAEMTAQQE